jgi:uncharacterized membrane protein YoaK (UPF0700 family)
MVEQPPATTQPAGVWTSLLADVNDGAMPAILLVLTVVTGLVDAVSILALGRVFVANMTGNVVFVGFALAGAPGFSLAASLSALGGFIVGASIGGKLETRPAAKRPELLRAGLAVEVVMLGAALIVSAVAGDGLSSFERDLIAALAAVALGAQNAVVRRLKVSDLTTTVLTMTLTGIAADIRKEPRPVIVRRVLAVATMLGGAVAGAALVIHVSATAALALAVGLLVTALVATVATARSVSA